MACNGYGFRKTRRFSGALPGTFSEVFLQQENQPARMAYFDNALAEAHGGRIKEILC